MTMKLERKAYAKINVSLKTLRKRDDGFHDLDMLMVNIIKAANKGD